MIDSETLEKLQKTSIEDRIAVIEALLQSLKADIRKDDTVIHSHRPDFGFMKDTGAILGDVVAPVLPENTWEALQ
jgi:hypothetical protein